LDDQAISALERRIQSVVGRARDLYEASTHACRVAADRQRASRATAYNALQLQAGVLKAELDRRTELAGEFEAEQLSLGLSQVSGQAGR
jgi:hypothetical protein